MAKSQRPKKDTVIESLLKANGNISLAAKMLKASRNALYDWITDYQLNDVLSEARETRIDFVESQLDKKIQEGDTTSIIFFLKTQGKSRGYIEKQEVENNHKGEIKITREVIK